MTSHPQIPGLGPVEEPAAAHYRAGVHHLHRRLAVTANREALRADIARWESLARRREWSDAATAQRRTAR